MDADFTHAQEDISTFGICNEPKVTLLSIVIPCFNRHDLICACLNSIDSCDRRAIQIVVVDDGSDPPLAPVIKPMLLDADVVLRQSNRGRAAALRAGVLAADGDYVLIMDSDDEFILGALDRVLRDLKDIDQQILGFVYECEHFEHGQSFAKLPANTTATLLSVRADFGVKGDLKEVVRTAAVRASLYADPGSERRVPTSYIWIGVSELGSVVTRCYPVVRHRYLPDGMTHSIESLKKQNPYWLSRTYLRAAAAHPSTYKSRTYRLRNAIKALAVSHANFSQCELRMLRCALGNFQYIFVSIVSRLVSAIGVL